MTKKRHTPAVLGLVALVASTLACNAPSPTPESPSSVVTPTTTATLPSEGTLPSPIEVPVKSPASPLPTAATSPLPTQPSTPSEERPTPGTPVSTGPLDFPVPTRLDSWQTLPGGANEATIILRITGGAPPYVVHHDLDEFVTEGPNPAVIFEAQGCSALVHTIVVESADGQSVKHDYWIPPPWCD